MKHTVTSFYRSAATKLNISNSELARMKDDVAGKLAGAASERARELERKRAHVKGERRPTETIDKYRTFALSLFTRFSSVFPFRRC